MALGIPDATVVLTVTAVGFNLVANILTRRFVDLDAERRMRTEINQFNKALREAVRSKNKTEEEKLRKKQPAITKLNAKISSARLKVSIYTIVPFFVAYYVVLIYVIGPISAAAYSPIYIPILAQAAAPGGGFEMSVFGWYLVSSFAFSGVIMRLLKTQTNL